MLPAETILMATGLVEVPTATHVRASRALLADLRGQLLAALDRDDPGRLYVCPERPGYFDRLAREPDYEAYQAALEPLVGTELADTYVVLHQAARRVLLDLRPVSTIDTVMGPTVLPLDSISEGRWALEVDVVEGLRIVKDLAAGALLKEEVDVFASCFSEAYRYLLDELDAELAKRRAAKASWSPPPWLADSIRVLERLPFGATLELKPPKAPEPSAPPPRRKGGELDTDALKTKGQGGAG
jgi:hypothetical protein